MLPSIVLDNLFGLNPGRRYPTAMIWGLDYKTNIISNIKCHEGYLRRVSTIFFQLRLFLFRNHYKKMKVFKSLPQPLNCKIIVVRKSMS